MALLFKNKNVLQFLEARSIRWCSKYRELEFFIEVEVELVLESLSHLVALLEDSGPVGLEQVHLGVGVARAHRVPLG